MRWIKNYGPADTAHCVFWFDERNLATQIVTFMWTYIVTNFFLIKPTDALISQIYFYQEILHFSGSSSAHHQEFSTVLSALVFVMQVWWHIAVPNVQWKTPDDGQRNCLKNAELLNKNKFGKLVRLLVLLKRNVATQVQRQFCIRYGRETLSRRHAYEWHEVLH